MAAAAAAAAAARCEATERLIMAVVCLWTPLLYPAVSTKMTSAKAAAAVAVAAVAVAAAAAAVALRISLAKDHGQVINRPTNQILPEVNRGLIKNRGNLVIGKKVSDGLISVKGADLTVFFYVGNVQNGVKMDDLKSFIEQQNVSVVEIKDIARKHNRFQSFRVCIKKKDIDAIKDPNFWPEDIIVRRFFRKAAAEALPYHLSFKNG